jgi:hypothetical protein
VAAARSDVVASFGPTANLDPLSPSKPPSAATDSAIVAKAIEGWKPPAALTGVDILPSVAALGVRNPVLQGAFMDPAYTPAFVKSLRAADGLRQFALPALLGSSLSAQVARPPLATALNLPKFDALSSNIAAIGERVALISQAVQGPA